ncbi:MAG: hypothetical protein J6B85_13615 [Lachnospiraceae bacterium]|nr:hypothetical protein [Lachnospiraceae bacterium]
MSEEGKILAGLDLCEEEAQLTWYDEKKREPESLNASGETVGEQEDCLIPAVLAVKPESGEWLFGQDALRAGDGAVKIDGLLRRIREGEAYERDGMSFSPEFLLERFLRKVLTILTNRFPGKRIAALAVTLKEADPVPVTAVYRVLQALGLGRDRAVVQSHSQSFVHYTLNQPKDIWMNDVGLFELDRQGLMYYQLGINRRMVPMTVMVNKEDLSGTFGYDLIEDKLPVEQLDYIFDNLARSVLHKKIVSTLYITGKGFDGTWADETLKGLCVGRRVFKGRNLYAKGACYTAKELLEEEKPDYLVLDEEMLPATVKVRLYSDARMLDCVLVQAGTPWYEAESRITIILDDTDEIDFVVSNPMKKESIHQVMTLDGFYKRENKTCRLALSIRFLDRITAVVTVRDLGFGDFYPSGHRIWEQILIL